MRLFFLLAVTFLLIVPAQADMNNGLVGWWRLNESSGNAADSSGNGNTGIDKNSPFSQSNCPRGNCRSFNGSNTRFNLATDVIGTNTVTVCAWIYPTALNSFRAVMSNARFSLYLTSTNNRISLTSTQNNGLTSSNNSIEVNTWQHVCAVRTAATNGPGAIYINGTLNVSGNTGTPVAGYGLAIGDYQGNDRPWQGGIDDVRVYNRELTPLEIKDLYELSTPEEDLPSLPGTVAITSVTPTEKPKEQTSTTQLVLTSLSTLGNNIIEIGEACDGSNVNGLTCANFAAGYKSGPLRCRPDGKGYDISSCVAGKTIEVASCSDIDIQAAITRAESGDTIHVPEGDCLWTQTVVIPNTKKLKLVGRGIGKTTLRRDALGYMLFLGKSGSRITGFSFVLKTNDVYAIRVDGDNWRIDHNKFESVTGYPTAILAFAETPGQHPKGVIDHNEMINVMLNVAPAPTLKPEKDSLFWATDLDLGTDKSVYAEDNTITFTRFGEAIDGNYGGRFVFRHNIVNDTVISVHSVQGIIHRATRSWEIYDNIFNQIVLGPNTPFFMRGGTGVIYNNTITGTWTKPRVSFDIVRDWDPRFYKAADRCSGGSLYDGNEPIEQEGSGTHTGSVGALVLEDMTKHWTSGTLGGMGRQMGMTSATVVQDTTKNWAPGALIGKRVWNSSDPRASAVIISNTDNTFTTGAITDGVKNLWSTGDQYEFSTGWVWNLTDGSKAPIISNTATTVTATLVGGKTNTWNPGDQYKISDGYPCRDQIGRSTDQWAWTTQNPYPTQKLESVYIWNNKHQGKDIGANSGGHIKEGRDFILNAAPSGYVPYAYPHPLVIVDEPGVLKINGDVSGDGKTTMYDTALVLRYTLGGFLNDEQKQKADVNRDTKIDGVDVVAIARKALGL